MGAKLQLSYYKNGFLLQRVTTFCKTGPVFVPGFKNKPSLFSVPALNILVCGAHLGFLTQTTRVYSTERLDLSSSFKQVIFEDKLKALGAFDEVPKPMQENCTKAQSRKSKKVFKTVPPISRKETSKNECLKRAVKSLPNDIDPTQPISVFLKELGFKDPSQVTFAQLIRAFSLEGQFRLAQNFFDLMVGKEIQTDEMTYCALMNAYSNEGELTKTIEIFELFRKDPKNQNPAPYTILIKAYMKHNRVQDAFDVFALMKQDMTPNIYAYSSLIQACIKARDNNRAWAVYEMMLKDGVLPDVVTYTMLISICQKADVKKALELFEDLLNQGIKPTERTVCSLLSALCSSPAYYSKAVELLRDLTTKGILKPDDFIFTVMINGAAVNKNLSDARRFFYRLHKIKREPKTQLISFSIMLKAYATAFPSDRAERVIKQPSTKTIPDFSFLQSPSPRDISECVVEAMMLFSMFKRISTHKEFTHDCGLLWATYLSVLTNYNYFNEAMRWVGIISRKNNHHWFYQFYKCMLAMCKRLHKEDAFFDILGKAEAFLTPIGPKSTLTEREKSKYKHVNSLSSSSLEGLYQSLIVGLAEFGRLAQALDYFEVMNQDPTIDWKSEMKYYRPFFKAIQDSSDSDLKLRLDKLI